MRTKIKCEDFERDVFLFVDGVLSYRRVKLIEHHLEDCNICKSVIEDIKVTAAAYDALPLDDVDESYFIRMINSATKSSSIPEIDIKNLSPKGRSLVKMFGFYRLTFGGAAVAAAIILIIFSFIREPSLEKNLPIDILDWHGDKIISGIEQIEDQILSLKSDEWGIYIVRKNRKKNWDATLKSIRSQINKMKKSTDKNEL